MKAEPFATHINKYVIKNSSKTTYLKSKLLILTAVSFNS